MDDGTIRIDCDDCAMQHTEACDDCIVSFVCSREPGDAVIIEVEEARAWRSLSEVGLLPQLRHRKRAG